MLYDTHAHLDMKHFDKDRQQVIQRARKEQIEVITVGIDLKSSQKAVKMANEHKLRCGVGIHPHQAKGYKKTAKAMAQVEDLARKNKRVVAIGEIGLDYYRNYSSPKDQKRTFKAQLELAERLTLPVIVHNRDADEDVYTILKNFNLAGVIHSFFGHLNLGKRFIQMGFYLGISGPITFPNPGHQKAVKKLLLERLLVETDCPYLTPVPHRGKRNEPAYLKYIAGEIAKLKGIKLEKVSEQTTANAEKIFELST